ncbi:hypothetical protein GCK32_015445, partial [Trichostrongylus colubriformis]
GLMIAQVVCHTTCSAPTAPITNDTRITSYYANRFPSKAVVVGQLTSYSTTAKLIAPGVVVPGTLSITATDLFFDADEENPLYKNQDPKEKGYIRPKQGEMRPKLAIPVKKMLRPTLPLICQELSVLLLCSLQHCVRADDEEEETMAVAVTATHQSWHWRRLFLGVDALVLCGMGCRKQ